MIKRQKNILKRNPQTRKNYEKETIIKNPRRRKLITEKLLIKIRFYRYHWKKEILCDPIDKTNDYQNYIVSSLTDLKMSEFDAKE